MRALICAVLLLWPFAAAFGQPGPRLPCGGGAPPLPVYAGPGAQPNVQVWSNDAVGSNGAPPGCTGWDSRAFKTLVAVAGSFRYGGSAEDLLARFGAVTALRGIRYWSVSDKAWRVLVTDAVALNGPDPNRRRPDFTAAEMRSGRDLYSAQRDGRSSGEVVYRMRVREFGPDRLVIETENVSPVRVFLITLFEPGDLRTVHFLERRQPNVWGYYGLSLTGEGASWLAGGHEASYVNRAVALFRYIAGIPTDRDPPLAP